MNKFWLLIGASLRDDLRWAKQHIYSWLILPPLVVGITYATVARAIDIVPPWTPSAAISLTLIFSAVLCLIVINLSRATTEVYFLRRPESMADSLPVSSSAKLGVALITRLVRTIPIGVILLLLRYLLGHGTFLAKSALTPAIVFCCLATVVEIASALNWVHWNHKKNGVYALIDIAIAVIGISVLTLVAAKTIVPNLIQWPSHWILSAIGIALSIIIYAIAQYCHSLWRAEDIEYAKRLRENRSLSFFNVGIIERKLPLAVASQVMRDLQLTLRAFSSSVYIVLIVTCFWLFILAVVLFKNLLPPSPPIANWFNTTWLPVVVATKNGVIVVTASLSVLVASLTSNQLPHLWLERTTCVNGLKMQVAKIWYARIVSFPGALLAILVSLIVGKIPDFYIVPTILECLFLWWSVSSFIGALSFEMPNHPMLATIVMLTVGISIPFLMALFWPAGIVGYFVIMSMLVDRGRARARVYLMAEAD